MRLKTMLRTAAVLALAVVAGLFGVSGAWALWSISTPADAGIVQSANFVVEANGDPLLVNGTSTTVALGKPSDTLTPESPVHASLTLANHSDATSELAVRATLGTVTVASENAPLAQSLIVESAPGSCRRASFAPTSSATSSATVTQGASQTFCLRMSLRPEAPASLSNSTATVTLPVHVQQIQSTP